MSGDSGRGEPHPRYDNTPLIIEKIAARFGIENYGGALSDMDEWHALEMGLLAGLAYGATGSWELVSGIVLVALGHKEARGDLTRQVAREPHYFAVGIVVGAVLGATIGGTVHLTTAIGNLPGV